MNSSDLHILPAPPSLMKSLMAGFDAITNHIGLILFTVVMDLFLWLGPRLNIANLFQGVVEQAASFPEAANPDVMNALLEVANDFNLFSVLRTFPVGVSSLMASLAPGATPLGDPVIWALNSFGEAFGWWLLLILIGTVFGSLYFTFVSQAVLQEDAHWQEALALWPRNIVQVVWLTIFWSALVFSAFMVFGCFLSALMLGGIGMEQLSLFAMLIFAGFFLWALVPLLFSSHGIFVNRNSMWESMKKSVNITRMTLPTTILLFLSIFLLSEGLRLLWSVPPSDSWFVLVGIAGHAFVTTSLLAGSFIYYRDADYWLQEMLQKTRSEIG
jgi:hypothetical protein